MVIHITSLQETSLADIVRIQNQRLSALAEHLVRLEERVEGFVV